MLERLRFSHVVVTDGVEETVGEAWIREPWLCSSHATLGNTAPFVQKPLAKVVPFELEDDKAFAEWSKAVEAGLNAFVIDQCSDKGSNMLPAVKDIAVRYSRIPVSLNDISVCELHVAQRIKNSVREVRTSVGTMHC